MLVESLLVEFVLFGQFIFYPVVHHFSILHLLSLVLWIEEVLLVEEPLSLDSCYICKSLVKGVKKVKIEYAIYIVVFLDSLVIQQHTPFNILQILLLLIPLPFPLSSLFQRLRGFRLLHHMIVL